MAHSRVERQLNLAVCDRIVTVTETVLIEVITIDFVTKDNNQVLLRGWSNQYHRPITLAELDEINYNLSHFFSLLLSWERDFKQRGLIPKTDDVLDTEV